MIICVILPKINIEKLKSLNVKETLCFPFSLIKGLTYRKARLNTPKILLITTPIILVEYEIILKSKIKG